MYLANTITGALFALFFMLRIDVRLTLLALVPLLVLPVLTIRMGKAIHDRFEAVQEHFSTLTTRAQENLSGARIVRAYRQEAAEIARFGAINDQYLALNMSLVRLWGTLNPLFAFFGGLGAVIVLGVGGCAHDQRHYFRRLVRRLRHVPHDAHLADDRAGLGRQSVPAR